MKKRLTWLGIPSLSIRRLVAIWAVCIVIAWMMLVGSWFSVRQRLAVLNHDVTINVQAIDEARDLETQIVANRHEYALWATTGQVYHQQLSQAHLQEAVRIVSGLDPYAETQPEKDDLANIRQGLATLQSQSDSSASLEERAQSLYSLLSVVHSFEEINAGQLQDSIQASSHLQASVSRWAIGLSGLTAVVLFGGALGILSRIVRPVLALRTAARAFGRGDFRTRAPMLHDDEMGTLASTFNNMAADIAQRENERLRFVAMVVHDLKNPAYAIEMATRALRNPALDEEKRRFYLNAMLEEAARLRLIVQDLTDDIQVASGQFSVHKKEVDLCSLARQLVERRQVTAWDHPIAVEAGPECRVVADPARIERVLGNLISNAVKYSPPKTAVTVRIEPSRTSVTLSVSDQGVGIAKEDLKMLFQPFGRGRTASTLAEGSGMGLYVVKQIVEAHGGQVTVESQPGRGTTFFVALPLAPQPAAIANC